ncbi:Nitrilase family, member 2 [Seminavis robusta]|uniref:Nitrilase family, member 2 n=1 Tax=Seminavis robusta TaxID=568900 RepID=A0A9N8DTY9_9STRA|nr:Nitrilase family, member 2 [Seminavis robusta]|eukprot:Sro341_g121500.1 Nitrilase family, member 2 (270) ;mRNA; f:47326-48135
MDPNQKLPKEDNNMPYHRLSTSTGNSKATASASVEKRSLKRGMQLLPEDFVPAGYSVICGRGRGNYNATGNRRLRVIVGSFLQQYIDAENSPHDRTRIVDRVVRIIQEACPVGGFVRFDKGRYYELSDRASREKCGAMFRDCIQAKNRERQAQQIMMNQQQKQQTPSQVAPQQSAAREQAMNFELFNRAMAAAPAPLMAQGIPDFAEATLLPLEREESSGSTSCSSGFFYDVDTNRSVQLDDDLDDPQVNKFLGNDSLMGCTLLFSAIV